MFHMRKGEEEGEEFELQMGQRWIVHLHMYVRVILFAVADCVLHPGRSISFRSPSRIARTEETAKKARCISRGIYHAQTTAAKRFEDKVLA